MPQKDLNKSIGTDLPISRVLVFLYLENKFSTRQFIRCQMVVLPQHDSKRATVKNRPLRLHCILTSLSVPSLVR